MTNIGRPARVRRCTPTSAIGRRRTGPVAPLIRPDARGRLLDLLSLGLTGPSPLAASARIADTDPGPTLFSAWHAGNAAGPRAAILSLVLALELLSPSPADRPPSRAGVASIAVRSQRGRDRLIMPSPGSVIGHLERCLSAARRGSPMTTDH